MKEVLFVILDLYSDWEAAYLSPWIHALSHEQYAVRTVSLTKDAVRSLGGFTVLPDYDIASAPADCEGVVLVGGLSWRKEEARRVIPLAQRALSMNKVLAGICDAAGFLAASGMLNGVRHTGNDLDDIKQWAGNAYTGENHYLLQPAVRDGNIVTANGTATMEFAKEVLSALNIAPESKISEWYQFHKLGSYCAPMPTF